MIEAEARNIYDKLNADVPPGERPWFSVAFRPMLNLDAERVLGYQWLDAQEGMYSYLAYRYHPEAFALWYELLSIGDRLVRGEHDIPGPGEDRPAAYLRLRTASVAVSTSKIVLDACLAGYYTQARALLRTMTEAWKVIAYSALDPGAARAWFPGDDGSEPLEVNRKPMNVALAGSSRTARRHGEMKTLAETLNSHAHHSPWSLAQTGSSKPGQAQYGATYETSWCRSTFLLAMYCTAAICEELLASHGADSEVAAAMAAANAKYDALLDAEAGIASSEQEGL